MSSTSCAIVSTPCHASSRAYGASCSDLAARFSSPIRSASSRTRSLATTFATLPLPYAWCGIICYTFQIYFDFAGYSDMAIGLARMMGFEFLENFNRPYTARSITEFWHRWHISLSNFMRDYLYIPLGGNRAGPWRTKLNLWLTFLASGLWHGASWNFVFWGAYHGTLLSVERSLGSSRLARVPRWLAWPGDLPARAHQLGFLPRRQSCRTPWRSSAV